MASAELPIDELRKRLSYCPDSGKLTWRAVGNNRIKVGAEAGHLAKRGYRQVSIRGRNYQAHRVAWALHHGAWPAAQIDHRNGVRDDNRIENLRVVTNTENARNQKLGVNNTSGRVGISWIESARKWRASIGRDGRRISLGRFTDFAEACAARDAADLAHGFHPNHGRRA